MQAAGPALGLAGRCRCDRRPSSPRRWVEVARASPTAATGAFCGESDVAVDARHDLERASAGSVRRARRRTLLEALVHELAVALDVGVHVGERAPVAGQAQARAEPLDDVERAAGTRRPGRASSRSRSTARCARAGGRRRSAGAARAGTGRRARGRGRASRTPSTCRGRWRRRRPASSVAVGLDRRRRCPTRGRVALGGVAAQRLLGHAALARDLQAPREHRLGVLDHARHVLVAGVHPQLAAGALDDRGGLAAVVGVRVRADEQARCPRGAGRTSSSARSRCAIEPGWCMPVSNSTKPSSAGDRPGVAVRHARPRQRQAQAIDARQHPLAPPQLALARSHRTRGAETRLRPLSAASERRRAWPSEEKASERERTKVQEAAANVQQAAAHAASASPGSKAEAVARRYFEAIDARDLDAAVALWAEGGRENVRGQVDVHGARGRARVHRRA